MLGREPWDTSVHGSFSEERGSRKEAEKEWQTAERNDKEGNKT